MTARFLFAFVCLFSSLCASFSVAQPGSVASRPGSDDGYATLENVSYYDETALAKGDDYQRSQCRLDFYYPSSRKGYATVLWFHGGGLTGGHRALPALLKNSGFAVVAVGYRLSPKGKFPCFLEDAAAATAWVLKNVGSYGGDPKKVVLSGHSAGAYLICLVGMDARWLAPYGFGPKDLAGLAPVSGQMTTHFLVRRLRGDESPSLLPVIDDYAPFRYASAELPPIRLIVGDRNREFLSRVEENAFMAVTLKNLGHKRVEYFEMGGLTHNQVGEGGLVLVREFVRKIAEASSEAQSESR